MEKARKRMLVFSLLVCALFLMLGCASCKSNEKKHNWDWASDTDGHWQYCVDEGCNEKTEKTPHVDADKNEICDECNASLKKDTPQPPAPVVKTETAVIYFHKPESFGAKVYAHAYYNDGSENKNLIGEDKSYEVTSVTDGWYKVEVEHPEGLLKNGSFTLKLIPAEGEGFTVTINAAEMWVSAKGNLFATKAAALKDEEEPVTPIDPIVENDYTIYMYAPESSTVTASVTGNMAGAFADGTTLTAVENHANWYSLTFKTKKDIKDGLALSFTVDDKEAISKNTNTKENVYFIALGDVATGYASYDAAEKAYAELTEDKVTVIIHVHKVEDWEDIYGHAYVNEDHILSGEFGSLKGTLDSENEGWYTFAIEVGESVVTLDGTGFTLMVYHQKPGSGREEYQIEGIKSECWVAYDGTAFETKEAAEEHEVPLVPVVKVEYSIHYFAPDWAKDEAVYVYTFEGLTIGGYETEMLADGETGWYKVTFKTAEEFNSFGVIFHTKDNETIKHEIKAVSLTEESLKGKAFYFIDNTDLVYVTKEDAETAYNEIVYLNEKVTVTVHVHKRENWEELYGHAYSDLGDLTGTFGSTTGVLDADNEGWYTFDIKIARKEILDDADGFTLMLFDMVEKAGREEYKIEGIKSDCWITFDGTVFETLEEAEEYELTAQPPVVTPEYAIYYYAPTWPAGEILYVYTYSGVDVGGYDTVMPAEEDATGWYKITFKNAEEFNGFSIIFHTKKEDIKHEIKGVSLSEELLEEKAFYFIDNGDGVYLDKETAVAAYEEYLKPTTVTIHVHKVAEWENLYGHAYTDSGVLTGGFGETVGVSDPNNEGWYTFNISVLKGVIAEDGTGFTLMIFDIIPEAGRNELKINKIKTDCWVTYDGHSFESKELAEAYDHVHSYDDTYLYEEDGVADPTYHWQICTTCGEESAKMLHEYSSTSNICIKCGYEKPLADHDHIWSEEYDTSVEGYHTQHCTFVGCSETNPQPHEYGDWVIDSEGVYEGEQGSRHRNCTVCGARQDNSFDALPVLYLRGDINGWGTGDEWKLVADYDAGTLTITGVVFDTVDKGWKLADESWGVQANYWNLDDASKTYFGVNSDGNAMVNVPGTYNIVLHIRDGWNLSVIKTA